MINVFKLKDAYMMPHGSRLEQTRKGKLHVVIDQRYLFEGTFQTILALKGLFRELDFVLVVELRVNKTLYDYMVICIQASKCLY